MLDADSHRPTTGEAGHSRGGHGGKPFGDRGAVVVCIASGPSLTADDCETVKHWREEGQEEKRAVIAVNSSFMAAPWADVVYAMDRQWWVKYRAVVAEQCAGLRVSPLTGLPGVTKVFFNHFQNSGAGAVSLAAHWGAKRIILLGYDCQKTGGKSHWHGDHPKGLGNAGTIATWPAQFAKMAKELKGPEIINCSRETALTMFERRPLAEVLNERP